MNVNARKTRLVERTEKLEQKIIELQQTASDQTQAQQIEPNVDQDEIIMGLANLARTS
jgi:hypothetical protein